MGDEQPAASGPPDYFSTEGLRKDLKGKTVRGGLVTGVSQVLCILVQLACIPVLSRLLSPSDFGVFAMATVFTGFAMAILDAGFSSATVQREEITRQQATNLFWIALLAGVAMMGSMFVLAFPIGWFFSNDAAPAVVVVLSTTFVLLSMTIQHAALLRRAMRFSTLAGIRVASVVLGSAVSVALAYAWGNYWALVAGQVALAMVTLAATWVTTGWMPGLPARGAGTRSMVEFGANLTAATCVNYVSRVVDKAMIGSLLGPEVLGLYERAHRMLLFPIQRINGPLTTVMIPALSRLLDEPVRYRNAYFAGVRVVAAVGMPLVAFAAVDAERLVPFVLGAEWVDAAPMFRALTPAALVGTLGSIFAWVHVSRGSGIGQLCWQVAVAVASLVGVAVGILWGAVGVAWGFSAARVLVFPVGVWIAFREAPLTARQMIATLAPPLASAFVSGLVALGVKHAAPEWFDDVTFGSIALLAAIALGAYALVGAALGVQRRPTWPQTAAA